MEEKTKKKFKFADISIRVVLGFIFNGLIVLGVILGIVEIFIVSGTNENIAENNDESSKAITSHIFSNELIYDEYTKIIYIKTRTYGVNCYVYLPYYSENGKLCRYVDGEIVEVSDNNS